MSIHRKIENVDEKTRFFAIVEIIFQKNRITRYSKLNVVKLCAYFNFDILI